MNETLCKFVLEGQMEPLVVLYDENKSTADINDHVSWTFLDLKLFWYYHW